MPVNTTPIFVLTPNIGTTFITAANVATDGSGNITGGSPNNMYVAFTAGANGSRVESITFTQSVATEGVFANTRISCYLSSVNTGATTSANTKIFAENALLTVTRNATTIGATFTFTFAGGLFIPSGTYILVTSSTMATTQNNLSVVTRGGDY